MLHGLPAIRVSDLITNGERVNEDRLATGRPVNPPLFRRWTQSVQYVGRRLLLTIFEEILFGEENYLVATASQIVLGTGLKAGTIEALKHWGDNTQKINSTEHVTLKINQQMKY